MIPERYEAKVARLGEIADRNEGSDLGDVALELASFVTESTTTEHVDTAPEALGPRIDRLAAEVDARLVVHELAISELYRRIGPDPTGADEANATVFKIPVRLADGVTPEKIREAIDKAPPGLTRDEVLDRLEELELLRRVANHTAVTVTHPRQGDGMAEAPK